MNTFTGDVAHKMPSGLVTVDRDGRITDHNPASERIFEGGLKSGSLLSELVRESQSLRCLLERCLTTGEVFTRVEFNVPVAHDTYRRIGINLSPITNSEGRIVGAICLLSDLTEIVELQNQIKLKENFALLGEMSAGIAHEFKNSIATISGYAQISASETDPETLHGYTREILKESQALAAMVTDFLNFARPMNASINEVDLVSLVRSVSADIHNTRPGNYSVSFEARTEATVPCDPTLMRQSILNLLINAVEALDGNGRINIELTEAQRDHVRLMVEDTGRGIPSHQLAKIFIPFFTTKPHGTGLGLSLVQKIVIAHNGKIEVQSTEGKGTRFIITLPRK
jgi:PAS domain S-box-containing protein